MSQKQRTGRRGRSIVVIALGFWIALLASLPFSELAAILPVEVSASPAIAAEPQQAEAEELRSELRGVWLTNVDSDVLFSKENLEAGIERLASLNFNTIYPTVWNSGYTLYPSDVAERLIGEAIEPVPEFENRDMLQEAIELGHAHGLAVIPWFEFGLMAPKDAAIVVDHPEWVLSRRDGTQIYQVHGETEDYQFVWLNPANPDVQDLLVGLITEVVTTYDIDGIQLDDHFGMPYELGYDDYTVRLYQQEHDGRRPPDDPRNEDWMRWRARHVANLMVKIFSAVRTRKPDCLISLSPNPKEFSYRNYLQDWYRWANLGFVDELVIQVYRTEMNRFVGELTRPELQAIRRRVPVSIGILTGLRILDVGMEQIEAQVQTTRDRQFDGFAFFFYGSLGDRDADFRALLSDPARRPDVRRVASSS